MEGYLISKSAENLVKLHSKLKMSITTTLTSIRDIMLKQNSQVILEQFQMERTTSPSIEVLERRQKSWSIKMETKSPGKPRVLSMHRLEQLMDDANEFHTLLNNLYLEKLALKEQSIPETVDFQKISESRKLICTD